MRPALTRSRTRTLRSPHILKGGAAYRWTRWKMPRQTLTSVKIHAYALCDMRADLVSIREGLSSPESGHLTLKNPSLSGLSEDITAAIVLLQCAEDKMFNLLPREEFASPT
jgi:hypothetical protein